MFFILSAVLNLRQTAPSNVGRRAAQPAVVLGPNSESDEYSTDTQQAITPTQSKSMLQYSVSESIISVPLVFLNHKQTAPIATNSKRTAQVVQRSPGLESRGHLTHTAPAPVIHSRNKQAFRIDNAAPSPSGSRNIVSPQSKISVPSAASL